MCLLFETIRIVSGVPRHIWWHEQRMNHARKEIWKSRDAISLRREISVPAEHSTGVVKCNIKYGADIQHVNFSVYEKRIIRSLKMVGSGEIDYHLKYYDRSLLENLFMLRGLSDEIIVIQNGLVTDTSMSNLIFFDGEKWFTPAIPLLKGTCRNRLLAEGKIIEKDIRVENIRSYTGCKLINAMRDPDEELLIPVSEIS
jgi:4-amino-4-deoxychorismate lyase